MNLKLTVLLFFFGIFGAADICAQNRNVNGQPDTQKEKLLLMAASFHQKYLVQRAEVERVASDRGWIIRNETDKGVSEIQYIDNFGFPQSYSTTNLNAGKTTNTDDIWAGGSTGLNLTGAGYLVGEWDGGGVLTTHQEFSNGAGTRVTQMDVPTSTHYHSTHVAGTMIAEGVDAAAHGMATGALLHAYEWNDDNAEMATAAAGGLTLSNHSYGWNRGWIYDSGSWYWFGNTTVSTTEDYLFGFYDGSSREWDQIAYDAPNYLIVKSAGNDRNNNHTGSHYYNDGTSWILSSAYRDPDGGADGYDCIDEKGVAKNVLTVGAINDITGGWTSPADVVMSTFSSYGPTDDGRIKPDLVANGIGLYSTTNYSNSDYLTLDGTSMASPNTTGTLVLLQDYYKTLHGGIMSAAALKGLAINTANEAGPANGPDYMFGWGLLNASGAANVITSDNTQGGLIVQATLVNGVTTDYTYYSNGANVNVTLCWTDPAGTPPAASLNPTTLMLVNNLDVRVIGATTNYPWILNPASPAASATKGNNFRDNVESVNMLNPAAGYYTIRISHTGSLSGGSQPYALIINGMTTPPANNYCSARSNVLFEYISKVTMGTINNSTGRAPGGYEDYTGMVNTIIRGASESLSVIVNGGYLSDQGRAWVDWNQDGDFTDAGEEFVIGSGIGPVYSVSIAAPLTALTGYTTMRVRLYDGTPASCGAGSYGETEDYTINVLSHCEAGGGCDEYISNVLSGTINNSSLCGRYSDYTGLSTSLPVNSSVALTVTAGVSYGLDQVGVWMDWNDDGDFNDANETLAVTGSPGVGPYTATIAPVPGTTPGAKVMRVRMMYTGTVDPCGSTTYGEVEDYTVNITTAPPNYWVGGYNHYWHQPLNWSLGHVPTIDEPVTIDNIGFQPVYVDDYPLVLKEECSSLTIGAGARLEIQTQELAVSNDLTINGQLGMTDPAGVIRSLGNVNWNSGSTANFTADGVFWVYGDWNFNAGSNASIANGFVDFTGSGSNWIRSYSATCAFPNINNLKSGAGWLRVSNASTQPLTISGSLFNSTGCNFGSYTSQDIILKGSLLNHGHYDFTGFSNTGTLVFDGTSQFLTNYPITGSGTGVLNNVRFSATTGVTTDGGLTVAGNLTIDQGSFGAGSATVTIAGNWTNTAGAGGFVPGTGRVRFNGPGHQYILSSETFNILEANMGAALRVNNAACTVTCSQYDWTSGGIDVLAGTFTAFDLFDSGLFGTFWVNSGGTLNLTQDAAQYTDLHGELHIYGGTMTVTGGVDQSYWPYVDNAVVEMSGGVLDFHTNGIHLMTSPTLTETITGGTIRTNGDFFILRTDFNPTGGTIELYGSTEATIHMGIGSNFYNLLINKGVVVDNSAQHPAEVFLDREGHQRHSPLSNSVFASSNLAITGDMTIQTGTFIAPSFITVGGNWTDNAGATGFTEGTGTVEFNGAAAADVLTAETFYNLNLNKTYPYYDALEIMQNVAVTNDLHLVDGSMKFRSPANLTVSGNLTIDLNAGLNAADGYGPQAVVGKNWANANTSYASNFGFNPGNNSTVTFNGTLDQVLTTAAVSEEFHNLIIDKSAGKFRPSGNVYCNGDILVSNGTWEDLVSGLSHSLNRDFTVAATGSFLTTAVSNTVEFKGSVNSSLTYSSVSGYFRNILVNKGIGYAVTQLGYATCQNNGNLTVNQGKYILNGNTLFVSGNIAVNSLGNLSLLNSSTLILADAKSLNVNFDGRLELAGTLANPVTIGANVPTAHYSLNVNSGGTIAAEYTIFKNTGVNGVNIPFGGTVDLGHSFRGCTFQDGIAGGTLLTLNTQTLIIRNAVFPTNAGGGSTNVTNAIGSGHAYFVDFSGVFSGEAFDADVFNLVDWVPTLLSGATASPATICAGSTSQLLANPTGGRSPYSYNWSPAAGLSNPGINNPVASPLTTTTYSVTVSDILGSSTTSNILVTVNPVLPVSAVIAVSANPSPPGNPVTFTATPVNGGSSPSYQWKKNGVNAGAGLPTYSYVPSYNDQVSCVVTSGYACPSGNPATSNTIVMSVVDVNTSATGTISSPANSCFDASNTVTVAGGGSVFKILPGASATMIAGVKISYLYGTTVFPGGYMHGYITTANEYCGSLPPAMVAVILGSGHPEPELVPSIGLFGIYPNPASGMFTLTNNSDVTTGKVRVDLFDMRGGRLLSTCIKDEKSHLFTVSGYAPGLYFVKVITGDRIESFKLIIVQ
ncbi:MAG: GEVED domain-containing protein [Bacteroidetes bacterium]|nr:GEVED domain-containing protein [Bacteroidota bacterium]